MSRGRLHTVCRSTPLSVPDIEQTKYEDSTLVKTISDKSCLRYLCDGQCGWFQALYVAQNAAARGQESQARLTAPSVGAKSPQKHLHGTCFIDKAWNTQDITTLERPCDKWRG